LFIVVDFSIAFWNSFAIECEQLAEILKDGEKGALSHPDFTLA
jgi:hypothetical protein